MPMAFNAETQVKPLTQVPSALTNESSNAAVSRLTSNIQDFGSVDSREHQRIAIYSNVIGTCHYLEAATAQLKLSGNHIKAL